MNNVIRFLVQRPLVVNLVSVFVVALGLFAAFNINREAFPNVNLDRVQVNTVYPGATPAEIEQLVITPIEQELKSLTGIDKMISVAFPGSGRIDLELDPNSSNRQRIVSDVQLAVDRAQLPSELPSEPSVVEIEGSIFPVIRLAISGNRTPLELKRLGDRIQDDLLELDGVAKTAILGDRKSEIRVVVDPAKLAHQRISVGEVASVIQKWNVNAPGGDLETPDGQKSVRIAGEFKGAKDVANVVLRANEYGQGIRLGDIAKVTETLAEPQIIYDVEGKPALSMIVMKKADSDIIDTVDEVKAYLATIPDKYGKDLKINTFQDFSKFTRIRLGVLTNNAMVGSILVFLSLILFLRPSVALTTTWGLPIVFLVGLYSLYALGITLNLISMMGFIMVLGMIVDDAIIIGENVTYHMEQGMEPNQAAIVGTQELIGPVTATVATTIVAFLPMMFMTGIIGKFIVAIPTVVIMLLAYSWLEAFLILPSHIAHVANAKAHPKERAWLRGLENFYGNALEKAVDHRVITVTLTVIALVVSFFIASRMSFQLFPPAGVDQFIVRVTAQPGTSIDKMRADLISVDKDIRAYIKPEHLEATVLLSGQQAQDEGDPLTQRGPRYGQIRVVYTPAVSRPGHNALDDMHQLANTLPDKYKNLRLGFSEIRQGPPTGRALEASISSTNTAASAKAAQQLMDYLHTVKGVTTVESGLQPGDQELHVVFDRTLAAYAGVDLATAANHVRAAVGGLRVTTTRRGTEEVDITIRFPKTNHELRNLKALLIPNQRGGLVPITKLAKFVQSQGLSTIRHKAGIRVVNVVANINSDIITSAKLNSLVQQHEESWQANLPARVKVTYGGEEEKNKESIIGLVKAMFFALIAIFFILAIQFNNLRYPFAVMLAIPFGAIGIIIGFLIHGLDLSFFAILGFVALMGVVVNSSLILIVFVQRALEDGVHWRDALIQAGRRRLRAVLLTAATTVFGLLPTAYGWGGSDPFVAPMALALSWGLIFATVITLIAIPATMAIGMSVSEKRRIRKAQT
jgi:multidrug efflux pump subunit AcrB